MRVGPFFREALVDPARIWRPSLRGVLAITGLQRLFRADGPTGVQILKHSPVFLAFGPHAMRLETAGYARIGEKQTGCVKMTCLKKRTWHQDFFNVIYFSANAVPFAQIRNWRRSLRIVAR